MPIFDYHCKSCDKTFENIEVWSNHRATKCRFCDSKDIERVISTSYVQMNSDAILHNPPDPIPPLEELRGKGTEGFKDKPHADTQLKNYVRRKDKNGNWIWTEKHRQYFHG